MEFRKERNFIVAYEDDIIQAKWDILTGQFIGKLGKPVKNCPKAFSNQNLPYYLDENNNNRFGYAVRFYLATCFQAKRYDTNVGTHFENLLSVGLFPEDYEDLLDTHNLNKKIISYCKERNNGLYNYNAVCEYLVILQYQDFLEGRPEWIKTVFLHNMNEVPIDFLKAFLSRAEREQIINFWSCREVYYIDLLIREYYDKCKALYGEVKVTPNLLTNYAHINTLYNELCDKDYDIILNKNNNQPFLYFQYGNYYARPLLTRKAFHEEGENQHNCVERLYMEKVHTGETYVVTVRRIDAPENSIITCEVDKKGNIVQYLTFANHSPTNPEQLAFYDAYTNHLKTFFG